MRMPHMDGVELLSTVCEKWPNIYRILLTGFADMSALKGAVNQGGIQCYIESKLLAITRDFWRCKLGLMTSVRMSDLESLSELRKYRGTRYDPELLDAFSGLLQQYNLIPFYRISMWLA